MQIVNRVFNARLHCMSPTTCPTMSLPTQLHSEIGMLQGIFSEKDRIDAQAVCDYVMFETNTCTSYRSSTSTSANSYPNMIQEASARISARSGEALRKGALSGNALDQASDRLELGKRCVALIQHLCYL